MSTQPDSDKMKHRQTYADDSGRGKYYLDDRTELGVVFDGERLKARLYDESECIRYRDETTFYVMLTDAGRARFEESVIYDWGADQ